MHRRLPRRALNSALLLACAQVLQERYGGFLSEQIVNDFTHYASVVFGALGDRVTYWSTFNEPATFCVSGYGSGWHAPSMQARSLERGVRAPLTAACLCLALSESWRPKPATADAWSLVHRTSTASRATCGTAPTMCCARTRRPCASSAALCPTARSA